jgi:hypothetical protein
MSVTLTTDTVTTTKYICDVRVHLSGAGATTDTLTATLNSGVYSEYDMVFLSQSLSGLTNYHWIPTREFIIDDQDSLTFALGNGNARTWGIEIIWRKP